MTERVAAIIEMRRLALDAIGYPPEAHVFGDGCGGRIMDARTAWEGACHRAGIVDLHRRDLRCEAGSRLLETLH